MIPTLEKYNRILIAPLHWGLGHATRCIPIIDHFEEFFLLSENIDSDYKIGIGITSPIFFQCPFFIFLLSRVSGIPLLEARADRRWEGNADYLHYKNTTPVLIPKLR